MAAEAGNISMLLRQLSRLRNISDYDLASPVRYQNRTCTTQEMMNEAMTVANGLLAALDAFSPGAAEDGCVCPTTP